MNELKVNPWNLASTYVVMDRQLAAAPSPTTMISVKPGEGTENREHPGSRG